MNRKRVCSCRFALIVSNLLIFSAIPQTVLAQDDHGNSCELATPIQVDGTVTEAVIDPAEDQDWLSFVVQANHRYEITTFDGSHGFYLRGLVTGEDCASVLLDGIVDGASFVASASGLNYLRLTSGYGGTGYCRVGLVDAGEVMDDYGNSRTTAAPIPTDGTTLGGIVNYEGDSDWFRFAVTVQTLYAIEFRALENADVWTCRADLFDQENGPLASETSSAWTNPGPWVRLLYYVPAGHNGDYFVRIAAGYPDSYAGPYELRVLHACAADSDGDGQITLQDLAIVLAHFGILSGATNADGDTDNDADVDLQDLSNLLSNFGTFC